MNLASISSSILNAFLASSIFLTDNSDVFIDPNTPLLKLTETLFFSTSTTVPLTI